MWDDFRYDWRVKAYLSRSRELWYLTLEVTDLDLGHTYRVPQTLQARSLLALKHQLPSVLLDVMSLISSEFGHSVIKDLDRYAFKRSEWLKSIQSKLGSDEIERTHPFMTYWHRVEDALLSRGRRLMEHRASHQMTDPLLTQEASTVADDYRSQVRDWLEVQRLIFSKPQSQGSGTFYLSRLIAFNSEQNWIIDQGDDFEIRAQLGRDLIWRNGVRLRRPLGAHAHYISHAEITRKEYLRCVKLGPCEVPMYYVDQPTDPECYKDDDFRTSISAFVSGGGVGMTKRISLPISMTNR